MKLSSVSALWKGGANAGGKSRFLRGFAGGAFVFFLLKGLVWLGIAAAAAWAALR